MENRTITKEFHILAFSNNPKIQSVLLVVFSMMYLVGVLGNLIIISVVCMDTHLQSPMYLFLSNLSVVDICYITVTLPKLMDILVSEIELFPVIQCFTQMYFFVFLASTEVILLSSMAYDRFVAICCPLLYHQVMNRKKCVLLLGGSWISGCGNSFFLTGFASELDLCHSSNIPQFYCDVKALTKIACTDIKFNVILFVEILLFGLFPFLLTIISYINIISSVLSLQSKDKGKAFSTCTSHLSVLTLFYGTMMCMYMESSSRKADKMNQVFSLLYTAVTPMLNPLIYSVRNKEVKSALLKIVTM